jgi:hypothetical protein
VPPNNGGKEIQENRENQESHRFTPFRTSLSWRDTSAGPYLKVRGNSQDCSRHSWIAPLHPLAQQAGLRCFSHVRPFQADGGDSRSALVLPHPDRVSK